jgi:O-antigen ligase
VSNALIIRAPNAVMLPPQQPRSLVHGFSLALVWLSVASGAIVLTEPAPVDLLTMALIVLLPIVGLVTIRPPLVVFLAVWLLAAAGAFISSITALDVAKSTIHSVISVYLYSAAFVFAAFIVKKPEAHTRLILNAYQWAAVIAATAALTGYFDLFPAARELFTKFDRASGTFKDPNVFAPFLVPALVGTLHQIVTRPLHRAILPAAIWLFLALALFLSYSRGAWINLAFATAIYGYFSFVLAPTNRQRLKMIALGLLGAFAVVVAFTAVLQNDSISRQFDSRATSQTYDEGPDGRFGGHVKARSTILDNPWGIGAGTFTETIHPEDVHHVYLSMFLNAGWIGGLVFTLMTLATCLFGLRHLFRRTRTRPLFLVAYAAFVAVAFEGFVIDIDHWRHFYLLMAIIWGLMIGDRAIEGRAAGTETGPSRPPRIIRRVDMLIIRPSRHPRIIGRLPRRHGRIVGPAKRHRDNRIVGPARRQLTALPVIPRRELIERPRRPDRIVYR